MAAILILGENLPLTASNYRGTYRCHPYHCDAVSDSHKANQAFFWFVEAGGEIGVVHDVAKALSLVAAYGELKQRFEVIEVSQGRSTPVHNSEFLGVDLSCMFNYSLLASGLDFAPFHGASDRDDSLLQQIAPLIELVSRHYRPKLNSNGLFGNIEDAEHCLACMLALQRICPNLWEGEGSSDFRPVCLHRVI
jgi:hypothetical protein